MKNVIKFFSLFVIIFAFFSTVQAYNLEYKATKTKIDKDKTVLRVKMSAGASEDSINSWNEISKNWNKYVKSGKIDDDGYYLSNDGGSCNTGRGDYNSVYTTFHKLDDLTTTYYTKPVNDCVRINYLTKVNGSKKDYKVAYVSRNSGNNPKTPNYAQFDTSDVSYGWKVSNGTQTFIRQFSLSQINTICKTFKLDKTKKSKLRLSTIGCSNDE